MEDQQGRLLSPEETQASLVAHRQEVAAASPVAVDDPAASLAGRKLTMARPDELVMVFDDLPGWHGSGDIQASALDTSARRHRYDAFEQNLAIVLQ